MTHDPIIFDRHRVRRHRDRAASRLAESDFLLRAVGERLADRLDDFTRGFPIALLLGAPGGVLAQCIAGRGGIEMLVQTDMSQAMLPQDGVRVVADEEFLPFAEGCFDLVIAAGSLHWINDLPGALIQIYRSLKAGGLFLGMLPGGQTLRELRHAFEQAEMSLRGGISPRVSPFVDVRDAAGLLQRVGFAMPVADSDTLTVSYPHPLRLMHDLRNMGEANALAQSAKGFTPCSLLMTAVDVYLRAYSDEEGRLRATFELVTMAGWKK